MDDELPSWGIGKLNGLRKMTLMLCWGLFFSFYFGESGVIADTSELIIKSSQDNFPVRSVSPKVAGLKFDPMEKVKDSVAQVELERRKKNTEALEKKKQSQNQLENNQWQKRQALVEGSPLEDMLPFITKYDRETASFLIAIAKKESDWGRHSPQKSGKDCFNYWGYRGTYNQTASGYSCFDSPEQAVEVVGNRIRELIGKKINTAEKMVVWKCGATCARHDPESVRKWISDVAIYYAKANS